MIIHFAAVTTHEAIDGSYLNGAIITVVTPCGENAGASSVFPREVTCPECLAYAQGRWVIA